MSEKEVASQQSYTVYLSHVWERGCPKQNFTVYLSHVCERGCLTAKLHSILISCLSKRLPHSKTTQYTYLMSEKEVASQQSYTVYLSHVWERSCFKAKLHSILISCLRKRLPHSKATQYTYLMSEKEVASQQSYTVYLSHVWERSCFKAKLHSILISCLRKRLPHSKTTQYTYLMSEEEVAPLPNYAVYLSHVWERGCLTAKLHNILISCLRKRLPHCQTTQYTYIMSEKEVASQQNYTVYLPHVWERGCLTAKLHSILISFLRKRWPHSKTTQYTYLMSEKEVASQQNYTVYLSHFWERGCLTAKLHSILISCLRKRLPGSKPTQYTYLISEEEVASQQNYTVYLSHVGERGCLTAKLHSILISCLRKRLLHSKTTQYTYLISEKEVASQQNYTVYLTHVWERGFLTAKLHSTLISYLRKRLSHSKTTQYTYLMSEKEVASQQNYTVYIPHVWERCFLTAKLHSILISCLRKRLPHSKTTQYTYLMSEEEVAPLPNYAVYLSHVWERGCLTAKLHSILISCLRKRLPHSKTRQYTYLMSEKEVASQQSYTVYLSHVWERGCLTSKLHSILISCLRKRLPHSKATQYTYLMSEKEVAQSKTSQYTYLMSEKEVASQQSYTVYLSHDWVRGCLIAKLHSILISCLRKRLPHSKATQYTYLMSEKEVASKQNFTVYLSHVWERGCLTANLHSILISCLRKRLPHSKTTQYTYLMSEEEVAPLPNYAVYLSHVWERGCLTAKLHSILISCLRKRLPHSKTRQYTYLMSEKEVASQQSYTVYLSHVWERGCLTSKLHSILISCLRKRLPHSKATQYTYLMSEKEVAQSKTSQYTYLMSEKEVASQQSYTVYLSHVWVRGCLTAKLHSILISCRRKRLPHSKTRQYTYLMSEKEVASQQSYTVYLSHVWERGCLTSKLHSILISCLRKRLPHSKATQYTYLMSEKEVASKQNFTVYLSHVWERGCLAAKLHSTLISYLSKRLPHSKTTQYTYLMSEKEVASQQN